MTEPMAFHGPAADEPLRVDMDTFTPPPDPDDPDAWRPGTYFEHMGERFRVAPSVGLAPLMDFAEIADAGVDANAMAGLVAMKQLLREVVDERDFARFWRWTIANRITGDGFGEIISKALAVADTQNRPTGSPSGLPGGRQTIGPNLNGISGGAGSPDDAWTDRKRALGIVSIDDDL